MAEQDLLKRYIDDGDMILGRVLQTKSGRELYERVKDEVASNLPLDWAYSYLLDDVLDYANQCSLSRDDARVLLVSMMMKAANDFLMKKLKKE